jgi:hypothetical protein
MIKKHTHEKRRFITALIMAAMLLTGASAASAAEVPEGVTEVKIPLALKSESVIAGAEIAFRQSGGLEYIRFEPASGAENPIKATAGGNTWVGFFSATNKYRPSDGALNFGNLVFRYNGSNPESVTVAETRMHSLTGTDSDVKSVRGKPNTVIPVTRQAPGAVERDTSPVVVPTKPSGKDGGGAGDAADAEDAEDAGGNGGDKSGSADSGKSGSVDSGKSGAGSKSGAKGKGNAKGNDKTNSDKDTGGRGNAAGRGNAGGAGGTNGHAAPVDQGTGQAPATDVGETAPETIVGAGEAEASDMVPFSISGSDRIPDQDIPLAGAAGQQENGQGGLSAWWMAAALIVGALAGALVVLLVLKRRRKDGSEPAAEAAEKDYYISNR